VDWIDLAQDRQKYLAVVNTVMNHKIRGILGGAWTGLIWLKTGKSIGLL
jgi:hypothetical protein